MDWRENQDFGYKRDTGKRIFVNRGLMMEKIKFIGFDMDYTLAMYNSPEYEALGFKLIIERLITIGYPEELKKYQYDTSFSVRGLWFDRLYGNLLKVDSHGNIMVGVHGFKILKQPEIEELYPNKFVHLSDRFFVLNTLFNLPETYILAVVVDFFNSNPNYHKKKNGTGVRLGDTEMSFRSIAQDIRAAVDHVHIKGNMKQLTVENLEKLVLKDNRLPLMLDRIRQAGKKVFLLTNSDYEYSNSVMSYLLNSKDRQWRSYFDCVCVDARKPLWFEEGTVFRQVDPETGALSIGSHAGQLKPEHVYSGGSCEVFCKLMGARGKDVLYVGDHIFGDVLRSKKARGWRTFLVIPELYHELGVWTEKRGLFQRMDALERQLSALYKNMDSVTKDKPDISKLTQDLMAVAHEMDQSYCVLGSLFRSGNRMTFFANQVERFADIYAASCCNLIYYPLFYYFRAPPMLLPHESTVAHDSRAPAEDPTLKELPFVSVEKGRAASNPSLEAEKMTNGVLLDTRATTPIKSTFVHEENSDEDSSGSGGSKGLRKREVSFSEEDGQLQGSHVSEKRKSGSVRDVDGLDDVVVMTPPVCLVIFRKNILKFMRVNFNCCN